MPVPSIGTTSPRPGPCSEHPVSPGRQQVPSRGHRALGDSRARRTAAHLHGLLGSQRTNEGCHRAQLPSADAGKRSHNILIQRAQRRAQLTCQLQHTLSVLLWVEGQWQCCRGHGLGGLGGNSQMPGAEAGGAALGRRRAGPGRQRADCGCAAAPWSSWPGSWASPVPGGGAPADTAWGQWGHGGGTGLLLGVALRWHGGTYIRVLLAWPHLRNPAPTAVWREGACVTNLKPEAIWGAGEDGCHGHHQGPPQTLWWALTQHAYRAGLAAVQLHHALHTRKHHQITITEAVAIVLVCPCARHDPRVALSRGDVSVQLQSRQHFGSATWS